VAGGGMAKKVFISFRGEDEFKVNTVRALAKFKNVAFVMDDASLRKAIESKTTHILGVSYVLKSMTATFVFA
jgi:hypothetical protein